MIKRGTSDSPRARFAELSPERRAQLLDPAEVEFIAHGFEGASLNRILAAAGMSKGQAYYYIADKADLYREVIERGLERLAKAMAGGFPQPATAEEFWPQIAAIFTRMTAALREDKRLAALARGIYEGPGAQAALAEPIAHIRAQADRLISIGQSVGAVRNDLPQSLLADTLFGAAREIDRWFAVHWSGLTGEEAFRLNEKAIGMIAAMAAPRPQEGIPKVMASD